MKKTNAVSLKAQIRNVAKFQNVSAQVILQNYMFERFLERLSVSEYRDKFILKGGLLIASMVGLGMRSTMDMDVTIRSYPVDDESVRAVIKDICAITVDDDVVFQIIGVSPIREDDNYGGFRVSLNAMYESIITPLSIDITTGDAITPQPIRRYFKTLFNKTSQFELWTYNTETILAEKVETILRRGETNTRPRDFYDTFIISKTQEYNLKIFREALSATALHRETSEQIKNVTAIIETIATSAILQKQWKKYQQEYSYAKDISFEDTVEALRSLMI